MMLYFIVPVYNEEKNIESLLRKTQTFLEQNKYEYTLYIVNDGSTDSTLKLIDKHKGSMNVKIIDQKVNKGVGESFKAGFERVITEAKDTDIIITKEADNTSDLSVLNKMIEMTEKGYDLVLASCYAKGGGIRGISFYRLFFSRCANLLLKVLFPISGVNTYSSFYRVYKPALIKRAFTVYGDNFIREKRFTCMAEILIKFDKIGARTIDVPMILNVGNRKDHSKMKVLKTMQDYLRMICETIIDIWIIKKTKGIK